jgi:hypothetical protein
MHHNMIDELRVGRAWALVADGTAWERSGSVTQAVFLATSPTPTVMVDTWGVR